MRKNQPNKKDSEKIEIRKSQRLNSKDKEEEIHQEDHKYEEIPPLTEEENEQIQSSLRQYNKATSQFEKLLLMPNRQVLIRRIAKALVREVPFVYKFPILNILEESSKYMLMTEPDLITWYELLRLKFKDLEIS